MSLHSILMPMSVWCVLLIQVSSLPLRRNHTVSLDTQMSKQMHTAVSSSALLLVRTSHAGRRMVPTFLGSSSSSRRCLLHSSALPWSRKKPTPTAAAAAASPPRHVAPRPASSPSSSSSSSSSAPPPPPPPPSSSSASMTRAQQEQLAYALALRQRQQYEDQAILDASFPKQQSTAQNRRRRLPRWVKWVAMFGGVWALQSLRQSQEESRGGSELALNHVDWNAYRRGGAPTPTTLPGPISITTEQRSRILEQLYPPTPLLDAFKGTGRIEKMRADGSIDMQDSLQAGGVGSFEELETVLDRPTTSVAAAGGEPAAAGADPVSKIAQASAVEARNTQLRRMHLAVVELHRQAKVLVDYPAGWVGVPDPVRLQVARELLEASAKLAMQLIAIDHIQPSYIDAAFLPPPSSTSRSSSSSSSSFAPLRTPGAFRTIPEPILVDWLFLLDAQVLLGGGNDATKTTLKAAKRFADEMQRDARRAPPSSVLRTSQSALDSVLGRLHASQGQWAQSAQHYRALVSALVQTEKDKQAKEQQQQQLTTAAAAAVAAATTKATPSTSAPTATAAVDAGSASLRVPHSQLLELVSLWSTLSYLASQQAGQEGSAVLAAQHALACLNVHATTNDNNTTTTTVAAWNETLEHLQAAVDHAAVTAATASPSTLPPPSIGSVSYSSLLSLSALGSVLAREVCLLNANDPIVRYVPGGTGSDIALVTHSERTIAAAAYMQMANALKQTGDNEQAKRAEEQAERIAQIDRREEWTQTVE